MPASLHVYEEITLLALREEAGTVIGSSRFPYAVAGAIAAELLLAGRIRIAGPKKSLVEVGDASATGDALLDDCLQRIATARRRAPLRDWVSRFAGVKGLKRRAAESLCRRGVLRLEEKQVLLLFRQKIYPEIDPRPEREIVQRLRRAIIGDAQQVEPRTVVLVALARATDLLKAHFERGELKERRARIKALVTGEAAGRATAEAIQAMEAAVMVAVMAGAIGSSGAAH